MPETPVFANNLKTLNPTLVVLGFSLLLMLCQSCACDAPVASSDLLECHASLVRVCESKLCT